MSEDFVTNTPRPGDMPGSRDRSSNDYQVGGMHYRGEYTQQHWDYCWERQFDPFQYVITKYVERHKLKNGLEDLRKAQHYLAKYIELLEADEATAKRTVVFNVRDLIELEEEAALAAGGINTEHVNDRYTHIGPDGASTGRSSGR